MMEKGTVKNSCGPSSCGNIGAGCCKMHQRDEEQSKDVKVSPPPSGIEMIKIAFGLCFACAISAIIVGLVFVITEPIKQQNLKARENTMIRQLLGLSNNAEIIEIRRYLSWKDGNLEVVYLTPKMLVRLDDSGKEIASQEIKPEAISAGEEEKNAFVLQVLSDAGRPDASYVGRFFAGRDQGALVGYVVEGSTLGFKAHIRFFIALTRDFNIRGVEVVQHEEDPGLGAEIIQKYFKNQFTGRSVEAVSTLAVTRDPLPSDWKAIVETVGDASAGGLSYGDWMAKHNTELAKHPNIYAITGSTISSAALTNGVKRAVGNFAKRMKNLEPYL